MSNEPLVSIVIPCFNAADFLVESIESCLKQTYQNCEIIVIDDGSTDNSVEILESFGDDLRWETGPNRGGCSARNSGFARSRGEFVKFLDADDVLGASVISDQVTFAKEIPGALIFSKWSFLITEEGISHVEKSSDQIDPGNDVIKQWLSGKYCSPHSLLWPRKVVEEIGGWDETLSANQDGDIFIRALLAGIELQFCPQGEVFYRKVLSSDRNSVSENRSTLSFNSRIQVLETAATLLHENGFIDEYSNDIGEAFVYLTRVYSHLPSEKLEICFNRGLEFTDGCIPGSFLHRTLIRLLGVKKKEAISSWVASLRG